MKGQARGSNGEPLSSVPTCPRCGSDDGSLGTQNAYFMCNPCYEAGHGSCQYWTADHQHPGDFSIAVAAAPFGRK